MTTPWRQRAPRDHDRRVEEQLRLLFEVLEIHTAYLKTILKTERQEGARTHMDLTQLQNDVAAQTTVTQSAVTLLGQLAQEIRDAAGDPAALAALADSIEANTQSLSDAVTQNTPPAEPPVETPPEGEQPI